MNRIHGVGVGSTPNYAQGVITWGDGQAGHHGACPTRTDSPNGPTNVVALSCTYPITKGQSTTCTVTGPSGTTVSGWKFSDGTNAAVTSNSTNMSWSGVMV